MLTVVYHVICMDYYLNHDQCFLSVHVFYTLVCALTRTGRVQLQ